MLFFFQVNGSALVVREVQHSDAGNYSCTVENAHGKDDMTYSLLVRGGCGCSVVWRGVAWRLPVCCVHHDYLVRSAARAARPVRGVS